jgi:hypothetical protein
MGLNVKFYNPANILTGGAKGALMGSILATSDQTVSAANFFSATSEQEPGTTNYYFRKIFLNNAEAVSILDPEIYFDDLEYPSNVTFARGKSASDTTVQPYAMPTGYETSDFFTAVAVEDRIPLFVDSSDLAAAADAAIWMRTKVTPGQLADSNAVGRLRLRGRRSP